jgi:cyclophilin family peptidyl-prolyl cis-trans isomerase
MLPNEFSDMKHDRGVVSTVRIPGKNNSDGAQFFVCVSPQPALDGQYSAFGRVTEGIDIVEQISHVSAGSDAMTEKPVRILKIAIEKKKEQPFLHASADELRKTVTIKTTLGSMKLQMQPDWAPENVRRFLMLAATGWLDGTPFHRVSKGFVVQGGTRSTPHAADRWIQPVKGEFRDDVKHVRGIVSMAHGDDPDSATTSFFFMLRPGTNLDGKFSAFARIVEGTEVLDAFEKEEVDGETPKRPLTIIQATID